MHHALNDSFLRLTQNPLVFADGSPKFVCPTAVTGDPYFTWSKNALEEVIPLLEKLFPYYEIDYAIWDTDQLNAWICPRAANQYVIAVSKGALIEFVKSGNVFFQQLSAVGITEKESALFGIFAGLPCPSGGILEGRTAEVFAVGAISAILGHELGHAHERQFEVEESQNEPVLVNHGAEFAADFWGVRVANRFLSGFFDIAREGAEESPYVFAADLLQAQFVLQAFSCLDRVDLRSPWAPVDPEDIDDTHPIDAARLHFAAKGLADCLIEDNGRPQEIAESISIMALERVLQLHQRKLLLETANTNELALKTLLERYDEAEQYLPRVRERYALWLNGSGAFDSADKKEKPE
ncbi:M48 family metalloprotease [Pseudoduganella umbonata]|uniref:Uncharacterized protein n=1 Tax=Pseudoduganella umbonata TaxID=864828 RepID=A0A4P8HYC5_9BURK|nr:M48 family metalloprotease [Pseudoduganella umbonata]MBB3224148.1 hypothetical protein [Pseudoduganella umbonata]QCP13992.1 hypothetical protein FCL38_28920 [Pseudoduganella umbonata]